MSVRNGIFGCGDWAGKIAARDNGRPQRPKGAETGSANPGTNGQSELGGKIPGSQGLGGGDRRARTGCPPASHRTYHAATSGRITGQGASLPVQMFAVSPQRELLGQHADHMHVFETVHHDQGIALGAFEFRNRLLNGHLGQQDIALLVQDVAETRDLGADAVEILHQGQARVPVLLVHGDEALDGTKRELPPQIL